MSNNTTVTCTSAIDQLFDPGCSLRGDPGSRIAGALKSCCPGVTTYRPEYGDGTNCYVYCNAPTDEQAREGNVCMVNYYKEHPQPKSPDKAEDIWTCEATGNTTSSAVRERIGGWSGLVVLCLAVSSTVTML